MPKLWHFHLSQNKKLLDMSSKYGEGETRNKEESPSAVSTLDETKDSTLSIPLPPFGTLNKYRSQLNRFSFRPGKVVWPHHKEGAPAANASCCQELSSESIVGMAKMRLLQNNSQTTDDRDTVFLSGMSSKNVKDVELTSCLFNAAEKISSRQFDCAEKLLSKCINLLPSPADNTPLERVVNYFADALKERVDIERGKIDLEKITLHMDKSVLNYQPAILAALHNLPSCQITGFTAIQAMLDGVGTAEKVHLVDFGSHLGMHGSIIMHGLANRRNSSSFKLFKITAIGKEAAMLEDTGRRLASFADSMRLPFLYKSIVSEIEPKEGSVEVEADEAVVVYFGMCLWFQLAWPNRLRAFIQFASKLKPCVVVVKEYAASTNNPIFIDRFHGAFSFMTAKFGCLNTCLTGDNVAHRKTIEEVFMWESIQNMMTAEAEERIHRYARIEFWRAAFAEFNFVEAELSESLWYQAHLVIQINERWKSCSLEMNGKSIIVGWEGTPLQSVSAWKLST